ncbi:hypothetical protein [Mycobacterium sp.]|uniref:hypothetical protein n=1 Tax=Mycobacterium sp. TaxID=1785 RepID=UPI0025F10F55|nr:hypothetical protein [Mycobacterium sp.]
MTDGPRDSRLSAHIQEFLRALDRGPGELIHEHIAQLEKPDPGDIAGFQSYIGGLRTIYRLGLADMYRRIALHGRAICELTDDTEITDRVAAMMTLVAQDAGDVPNILASFDQAANALNPVTAIRLYQTILGAGTRGIRRQKQLDELIVDLTAYCLKRFPPVTPR